MKRSCYVTTRDETRYAEVIGFIEYFSEGCLHRVVLAHEFNLLRKEWNGVVAILQKNARTIACIDMQKILGRLAVLSVHPDELRAVLVPKGIINNPLAQYRYL